MIENVDTLIIGFDFDNYTDRMRFELSEFEEMKKKAMSKDIDVNNDKVYITFLGMRFEILGNGKMGYAFILHSDLLEIDVAKFRSKNDDMYPIVVRFKAELLWSDGLNCYHWFMDKLIRYVGVPIAEKISRVDLACHTDEFELEVADIDAFVGRHRKDSVHRKDRRVQTVYVGSRKTQTIMLRAYNKSSMIAEERKGLWFIDIWLDNGMNPTEVWNVEFELHRKALKELKVDTFDDLTANIRQLWEYLTRKWVRLVSLESATERKNCKTRHMWFKVQDAYGDRWNLDGKVDRQVILLRNQDSYLPSIAGYITSYAAMMNAKDVEEVLEILRHRIPRYLDDKHGKTFDEAVKDKYGQQFVRMLVEYEIANADEYWVTQSESEDNI